MDAGREPGPIDVVLEAPASASIYLTALVRADRAAEVAVVERAHDVAARGALGELERTASWTARSQSGMTVPHTYDVGPLGGKIVLHRPLGHHDLHAHLLVSGDIDGASLQRALPAIARCYIRLLTDSLADSLGLHIVVVDGRPEIDGVPPDVVERFESAPCRIRAGARQVRAHLASTARA